MAIGRGDEGKVNPLGELLTKRWFGRTALAVGLAGAWRLIGTWCTVQNIPTWVSTKTESNIKADNKAKTGDEKLSEEQNQQITKLRASTQVVSALGAIVGAA